MDLTEAVDIKKRWQEYTEEVYKKNILHNKRNYKQGEKTVFRMGENNSK